MKQTLAIGMLNLVAMMTLGCGSESDRMANMAGRMVQSQNEVNSNVTRANAKFVELNRELQKERLRLQSERQSLNKQLETLEQDRRDLHRERRSELAWSDSFRFLAIVIAAITPLFLCAFLIWAATRSSVQKEEVNSMLLHELVSEDPRLISAPNLRAIEHSPSDEQSQSVNTISTQSKNRRKNNLTHRENKNGNS